MTDTTPRETPAPRYVEADRSDRIEDALRAAVGAPARRIPPVSQGIEPMAEFERRQRQLKKEMGDV